MRSNEPSSLSRRAFIGSSGLALTAASLGADEKSEKKTKKIFRGGTYKGPLAVGTWDHGTLAARAALRIAQVGGRVVEAVEKGINLVEVDPKVTSVGLGGYPNAKGIVELDAAIMDGGPGLRCGSVQSIQGISTPISVARKVMEKTPHVQLVGEGARKFALEQGYKNANLLTPNAKKAWENWKNKTGPKVKDHDTVGVVLLGRSQRMAAGCSTSGLAWKLPGRVGDSPIIGAGLYCDSDVGGASATGVGEEVLRVCGSFLVVEAMRRGATPQEAVEEALARIIKADPKNKERQVAFIALSKTGGVGAASIRPGFQVAIEGEKLSLLLPTYSLES